MRIGIIGLKGHQSVVLAGARELGNCRIVAVADEDLAAVEQFIAHEPLARGADAYQNWRHLLEHAMLDVCVVCDESGVRAEQLLALLDKHIHIVTEKPLTTTLDDLQRVRQAMTHSRSKLTMLLTMRSEGKYRLMRELVAEGKIGTVCQVTAQKSYRLGMRPEWQKSRARLGGVIAYVGIHSLDLIRWTTGLDFTHVAAFHGNLGTPAFGESEDHASLLLKLSNGASVTARIDYLRPATMSTHGDDRLRIAGNRGIIEVRNDLHDVLLATADEPPRELKAAPGPNFFTSFVRSLDGKAASPMNAAECLSMTEIVLRARDAADRGELIKLNT